MNPNNPFIKVSIAIKEKLNREDLAEKVQECVKPLEDAARSCKEYRILTRENFFNIKSQITQLSSVLNSLHENGDVVSEGICELLTDALGDYLYVTKYHHYIDRYSPGV